MIFGLSINVWNICYWDICYNLLYNTLFFYSFLRPAICSFSER